MLRPATWLLALAFTQSASIDFPTYTWAIEKVDEAGELMSVGALEFLFRTNEIRYVVFHEGAFRPKVFPIMFVEKLTRVKIMGADRQLVGEVAAEIRSLRKPEPYKGKGIKYLNEVVRRKAGKAAAATSS